MSNGKINWKIKKLLADHQMRQKDLAILTGKSEGFVSKLLRGKAISQPLEEEIAAFFGRTRKDLFP